MAQKRGNGHGNDPNLVALKDVVAELRGLREDTNARLEDVSERLVEGFGKVNARLERVEDRLDNIRDLAGEQYRALEQRIARIEARLPVPR
jgi:molybdenum-dependent DNA-binding transcriptional regulator ModE